MSDASNSADPSDAQQSFLTQNDIVQVQAMLGQTASEYLAEGIFLILAIIAMYTILHKGLRGSLSRQFSLGIIVVLLLSSLIGFSADLALFINVITMLGLQPASPMLLSRLDAIVAVCSRVNYLISDIIVAWRAWVLCDRKFLRALLAITIFISAGCTLAEGTITVIANFTATDNDGEKPLILSLILLIPLLVTNILATSIVGYRTWTYRKEIKIYNSQEGENNNIVEKVLVILLESGAIYCVWWIVNIFANFYFATIPSLMIGGLLPYIAAIYPTAVILLVALSERNNPESDNVRVAREKTTSIQFAQRPITSHSVHTTHSIVQVIAEHMRSNRVESDDESGTYCVENQRRSVERRIEDGSSGNTSTAVADIV